MGTRNGTNFQDRNNIAALTREGMSSGQIARTLKVSEHAVQGCQEAIKDGKINKRGKFMGKGRAKPGEFEGRQNMSNVPSDSPAESEKRAAAEAKAKAGK